MHTGDAEHRPTPGSRHRIIARLCFAALRSGQLMAVILPKTLPGTAFDTDIGYDD
jgi:hypothetical protein